MNEEGTGRWLRKLRLVGLTVLGIVIVSSPWWAPRAMSHLSFFRLQRVEVHGLVFITERELLQKLAVDTTQSIWMDLRPIEKRLLEHPQLLSVTLSRKLPGTLVVRVQERQPLALVPRADGFTAIDDSGRKLPVDPTTGMVDVPILHSGDSSLVRLLSEVRKAQPSLYRRISAITRVGRDELRIELRSVPVLAMSNVTVSRLLDILPVERDLALKGIRVVELDLRYSGQVIARQTIPK